MQAHIGKSCCERMVFVKISMFLKTINTNSINMRGAFGKVFIIKIVIRSFATEQAYRYEVYS